VVLVVPGCLFHRQLVDLVLMISERLTKITSSWGMHSFGQAYNIVRICSV